MPEGSSPPIRLALEIGKKRTFASALDWPGWCRSGREEAAALQAMLDYAPRYQRVLAAGSILFETPANLGVFEIAERLAGDATTDFGAPGRIPAADFLPLAAGELGRLQQILQACWQAFDGTLVTALGKPLQTGPRGGGRTVAGILDHVIGGEESYLVALGGSFGQPAAGDAGHAALRRAILDAMAASARGEIAATGPRGGKRWPVRYFARRAAWHVLDHLWEVEDRSLPFSGG